MGVIVAYRPHIQASVTVVQPEFHFNRDQRRSHAADAIKSMDDVWGISDLLASQHRDRDNMLFLLGINYGLRCGDLVSLRIGDVLDPHGNVRDSVILSEEKTGKYRTVYNNATTENAILKYFAGKEVNLDDWLFRSESNHTSDDHLTRYSVERILKKTINEEYGLPIHASTHCLRKTFGYQTLMHAKDRSRGLELVQKLLNHSSPAVTMRYIGITDEELRDVYKADIFRRPMDFELSSGLRYLA